MGLWDHQLADLEAMGLRFSAAEERALEKPTEGLQVLHLQPLWDPGSVNGQAEFMTHDDGSLVYVPEILDLCDMVSVIDEVDNEYGILDAGYPFYLATLDYKNDPWEGMLSDFRADQPMPYPFYSCLPITTEMEADAARRLIGYTTDSLRGSAFVAYDFIVTTEASTDHCISAETIWLENNGGPPPDEAEIKNRQMLAEQEWVDENDFNTTCLLLVDAFQTLLDVGFVLDPRIPDDQWVQARNSLSNLVFPPVTDFIPEDDWFASDMLRSLQARQRHFQRLWTASRTTIHDLNYREGVIA